MLFIFDEAGAVRYSISGLSTIPIHDSGAVSSMLKKKSQSSKPERMDSSYPPHCSNISRRRMCVAGQQLRDKNELIFPPAGQTMESKIPNVCIRDEAATMDGLSRSNWLTYSVNSGSSLSSPSNTNTIGASVFFIPVFLAEDTPLFS